MKAFFDLSSVYKPPPPFSLKTRFQRLLKIRMYGKFFVVIGLYLTKVKCHTFEIVSMEYFLIKSVNFDQR